MIADRLDLERVEHAVARILAETAGSVEVYSSLLAAIGISLGWDLGAVWEVDPEDGRLRCVQTWHTGEGAREFEALSERLVLAPGEGLPGRVAEWGRPTWIRRHARGCELPACRRGPKERSPRRVRVPAPEPARRRRRDGVLRPGAARLDEPPLATMETLGSQVASSSPAARREEEVRASESRLRAMLEAALDAVA
jgi:GAF domain-containing protein